MPTEEIASSTNDYNLNIPRYIDSSEPEDLHDLTAHLKGGIPDRDLDALSDTWEVFPTLRSQLFRPHGRTGYNALRVEPEGVRAAISDHPEVRAFTGRVVATFDGWSAAHESALAGLDGDARPRELIATLSEDLLDRFNGLPLLDPHDVYQRLMDYWIESMQDDVYLIASAGWEEAARPGQVIEDKKRKIKETPDLAIGRRKYKMDLIPPDLLIARCFADEQAALDAFRARKEAAANELQEFIEEHGARDIGEEAPLADAVGEKGKITQARLNELLKALPNDAENKRERRILTRCLALLRAESAAIKDLKAADATVAEAVLRRYATLGEDEIKALVIADKWLASLRAAAVGEAGRLTQRLTVRIQKLEDRYATPLPDLERKADASGEKVAGHLQRMGLA